MKGRLAIAVAVAVAVTAATFAVLAAAGGDDRDGGRHAGSEVADAGWSDEGRRVFAAMGCGSCHQLAAAGSSGMIGPNLDEQLTAHDRDSLARAIVRPPRGNLGTMPGDYGERLTDAELDALVSFLLASSR